MSTTEKINGFRRDELAQLKHSLDTEPGAAKFIFRARNRWIDGAQSINLVSSFHGLGREFAARPTPFIQTTDTPPVLLGKDLGPSPIEELLVALAASVTTTLAYRASAAEIALHEIECEVEAELNIAGAMESDATTHQQFEQIRVTVRVKSDASQKQLAALCQSSPVLNALIQPVAVTLTVKKD